MPKKAIIIGAGPAGLTAAYELLKRTDIIPVILEKSGDIGGISKTVNYKGNRIDIGGHRFFSKSDRVMTWWMNLMPVQPLEESQLTITYQRHRKTINTEETMPRLSGKYPSDKVMLVRTRLSRIYFLRKFFSYPIQLSIDTLQKFGLFRTIGIMASYVKARMFPRKPEKSLEDFFINRFGENLYRLFFKDYTEKVWGVPCSNISAEWGAQRIKGISISKALAHAIKSLKTKRSNRDKVDIAQKNTETSLIEKFLYPKYGPGQLWEEVARQIEEMGGKLHLHQDVTEINSDGTNIRSLITTNSVDGKDSTWEGDYFFSTMPVKELIAGMGAAVPHAVRQVAAKLQYRDFITVGILLNKMPQNLPDTWIYIQERDVKVGRLQIFNNWSPYMVKDPNTFWLGMEYFCNTTDAIWQSTDQEIKTNAIAELEKMGLASKENVIDSVVLRIEKTYPAYFGSYDRFAEIRQFTDRFPNLFLIGRNGMHKYNNSDHSMLTAMVSVDNILAGVTEKNNIWSINTEQEYHEEKNISTAPSAKSSSPAKTPNAETFSSYIRKNKWNNTLLKLSLLAIVLQFIVFKLLYPYAGFINGDSYVYLQTALNNSPINTYPVGYSNFLRFVSVFTASDTALVALQYLLLELASLGFIFSVFFFYRPTKLVQVILNVFVTLNPIFLYISNYVSSDALFIALSIFWFTLLLWIIHRSSTRVMLLQIAVLFYVFTVRYNALYYPFLLALALLFSRQKRQTKLLGLAGSILVIGAFVWNTSSHYKELTGIRQFTPFSGWQIANNALYAYRYVDSADVQPVPKQFKDLDQMVRHYFDTSRNIAKHPVEALLANTFYMWDSLSPLQKYTHKLMPKDTSFLVLKRWASFGPLFSGYGSHIIRQYPLEYARYYLWPNALKFYTPPVEFLDTYNMGRDTVAKIAKFWFRYKDNKVKTAFKDFKVNILNFYPVLSGIVNILFLFCLLCFGMLQGFRNNKQISKPMLLGGAFWLINFTFSVVASPVALRFQVFPLIVFVTFSLLIIEYVYIMAFKTNHLPGTLFKEALPAQKYNAETA